MLRWGQSEEREAVKKGRGGSSAVSKWVCRSSLEVQVATCQLQHSVFSERLSRE